MATHNKVKTRFINAKTKKIDELSSSVESLSEEIIRLRKKLRELEESKTYMSFKIVVYQGLIKDLEHGSMGNKE